MNRTAFPRRRLVRAGLGAAGLVGLAGCGLFDEDKKPITPGHRIDIMPTTIRLVPDPALAGRAVTVPTDNGGDEWPQPGRVATHVAANPSWSGSDQVAWSVRIGSGQGFRSRLSASPLVADGRVYTMDSDANIDAFDVRTGRPLWHLAVHPKKVKSSNIGGGITYADGAIYGATGLATAVAVDAATGKMRWRVSTQVPARSAPTAEGGKVMFGLIDQRLLALDAATGKTDWSYAAQGSFDQLLGQPAPAASGNIVVAGFGSGELATLNGLDGSVLWTDTLGGLTGASPLEFASIYGLPVIDRDTVYAISAGGLITATDLRTGRRVWERAVGGTQSPVVTGDWIFLLTTDQTVVCLDEASGHVRWTSVLPRYMRPNTEKQPILWSGPTVAGGKLVLVSDHATMVVLDPAEGEIEALRKLKRPASAQAPIAGGGLLLVLTDDGTLTAFR